MTAPKLCDTASVHSTDLYNILSLSAKLHFQVNTSWPCQFLYFASDLADSECKHSPFFMRPKHLDAYCLAKNSLMLVEDTEHSGLTGVMINRQVTSWSWLIGCWCTEEFCGVFCHVYSPYGTRDRLIDSCWNVRTNITISALLPITDSRFRVQQLWFW